MPLLDELEKECLTAVKYVEALKVKDLSEAQKEDILGELSASITHLRIQTEQLDKRMEEIVTRNPQQVFKTRNPLMKSYKDLDIYQIS